MTLKKAHLSGFSAEYPTLYNPKVFSFELLVGTLLLLNTRDGYRNGCRDKNDETAADSHGSL